MSARKSIPQGVLVLRTGLARWIGPPSPYAHRFYIVNISKGGVCFENHNSPVEPFITGQRVVFQVLGARLNSFRVTGEITWTTAQKKTSGRIQRVGMKFRSIPRRAQREIAHLN